MLSGRAAAAPFKAAPIAGFSSLGKPAAVLMLAVGLLFSASSWVHLRIPEPTGDHAIGRRDFLWTDPARLEPQTSDPGDHREIGLVVWYPADPGSGSPAPYVPDLPAIGPGLIASGELGSMEVAGLRWIRSNSRDDARIDSSARRYPLLLLSPGNATNVEFYGSLAEDLASNGYVVVGLNHPFQVTAMALSEGSLAIYDSTGDSGPGSTATKIEERASDVEFVLQRITREVAAGSFLDGRIDLSRIGLLGHSNGGLAAVAACRSLAMVKACMNIDGQAAAGPFGTDDIPSPVGRPFMYLTKETELHPTLAATFEQSGAGTFRVVVPAATHQQFADGPLFRPGFWPLERTVDRVHTVTRGFTQAFFDEHLAGGRDPLEVVDAPTDVYLYGYPLVGPG